MVGNEKLQTSNLDGFEVVNSDVTISFRQFSDDFPKRSTIMKAKSCVFQLPISLRCQVQLVSNFRILLIGPHSTECTNIGLKEKCKLFGSFDL